MKKVTKTAPKRLQRSSTKSPLKRSVVGFINAGGKGTRLHPITLEIPKPLLTIGRKPIIQYQVELFRKHHIHPIFISINKNDTELFEKWKKDYKNKDVTLVIEKERLGTWGGIRTFLKKRGFEGIFVVSNGDELKEFNLTKLIAFHNTHSALITIGAATGVANPSDYSVLEVESDGKIKAFHYKPKVPPSNLTHAGTHVGDTALLTLLPREKVISFEEQIVPLILEQGRVYACPLTGRWHDCGTFDRYEQAIYDWTGKTRL